MIRMELAAPGNQILGGNFQLYNGAGLEHMLAANSVCTKRTATRTENNPVVGSILLGVYGPKSPRIGVEVTSSRAGVSNTFNRKGRSFSCKPAIATYSSGRPATPPTPAYIGSPSLSDLRRYNSRGGHANTFATFVTITSKTPSDKGGVLTGESRKNLEPQKPKNNGTASSGQEYHKKKESSFFNQAISTSNLKAA